MITKGRFSSSSIQFQNVCLPDEFNQIQDLLHILLYTLKQLIVGGKEFYCAPDSWGPAVNISGV